MTEKPKIQLFNSPVPLTILLVVPLVVYLILATSIDRNLFLFLAVGLLVAIGCLIHFHNQLVRKKGECELQCQDLRERINIAESEFKNEEKLIEGARGKIANYLQLKDLVEKLSACLTLEDTLRTLSSEVNRFFGEHETTIILYLFHSKTGQLGISSSQKGQMQVNIKSKNGDIFDVWVVRSLKPLLSEDIKSDFRFDPDRLKTEDDRVVRSVISVPLMVGTKTLGILRLDSPRPGHFSTEDLRFLTTIAELGALAIENAQLYEHVEELAIKDGLTQLYLRRYLMERLSEETARHLRHKSELSLLMIDLDHFKKYNDQFGHQAGDLVLKSVAKILSETFTRPGDLVARYGGEEFAVLLPDCPKKKAVEIALSFRQRIEKETLILRREKTSVTVSVGVATFPVDAAMKDELIHKADQALYEAKKSGRNRVCAA